MTTQEMIAVLSAYQQGKNIESHSKTYPKLGWSPAPYPIWNFDEFDYRIVEEPEYVPYDGTQEGTLVGKIVVSNATGLILMLVGEDKKSTVTNVLIAEKGNWISYEDLFKHHTFLDGQPCGMLKKKIIIK